MITGTAVVGVEDTVVPGTVGVADTVVPVGVADTVVLVGVADTVVLVGVGDTVVLVGVADSAARAIVGVAVLGALVGVVTCRIIGFSTSPERVSTGWTGADREEITAVRQYIEDTIGLEEMYRVEAATVER